MTLTMILLINITDCNKEQVAKAHSSLSCTRDLESRVCHNVVLIVYWAC